MACATLVLQERSAHRAWSLIAKLTNSALTLPIILMESSAQMALTQIVKGLRPHHNARLALLSNSVWLARSWIAVTLATFVSLVPIHQLLTTEQVLLLAHSDSTVPQECQPPRCAQLVCSHSNQVLFSKKR